MANLTRFAPSPTGYLHLGHAHAAWAVAALAEHLKARMILRIEDIDPTRCRPEFETAILEDLAWLGLEYAPPLVRQSARMKFYAHVIDRLKDRGLIYPCSCTRKQVISTSPGRGPDGPIYAGTCKEQGPDSDKPVAWRLNMSRALAHVSNLPMDPQPWGDLILVRRETSTSYHLSVVIDDADQGVTHVMRGRDLEGVTAVHILLQRVLNLPTPYYAFHDLLLHDDGTKFSKSEQAPSLRDLRASGQNPEALKLALNRVPNLRGQIDAIKSGNFL